MSFFSRLPLLCSLLTIWLLSAQTLTKPHSLIAQLDSIRNRSKSEHLREIFSLYSKLQNKEYKSLNEFNYRMRVFRKNLNQFVLPHDDLLDYIQIENDDSASPRLLIIPDKRLSVDFNTDHDQDDVALFELNKFSDLTDQEFDNLYLLDQSYFDLKKFPVKFEADTKFEGIAKIQKYLAKLEAKGVQISQKLKNLYLDAPSISQPKESAAGAGFTPHFSTTDDSPNDVLFSDSDLLFSPAEHHSSLVGESKARVLQAFQAHWGRGPRRWGNDRHQSYRHRFMDSPHYPTNRESYYSRRSEGSYIPEGQRTISIDGVSVPTYINWRDMNAMTPVKDQFKCNACYAFSATAAIEAHHKINTGRSVSLAEQEIVDCSRRNKGCVGGLPHLVYEYIESRGISFTSSYRYDRLRHSPCRRSSSSPKYSGSNLSGYRNLRKGLLNLIKELSNGPIATISFASFPFKQYRGGIYRGQGCYGQSRPNHSSLLIGYKLTGSQKYLYFKNGWGTDWGERGYYKVQLGQISNRNTGHCLIASTAYNSIPIM